MKSETYSHGEILSVHRDKDRFFFCFVLLDDGREIFFHEGRHRRLEVTPDWDVVFDPRDRADRTGQMRWEIKPPEKDDRIVCVVLPATRKHHRDYAHYWAYERDWWQLWSDEGDRRVKAQMAEMDAEALYWDEAHRLAAEAAEEAEKDLPFLGHPYDDVVDPDDLDYSVHNSGSWLNP